MRLPNLRTPAKFKPMSDLNPAPSSEASSSLSVAYGLWLLMLLVVCYVLSPGPLAKVCGSPAPPAVRRFYAPLGYPHDHVPAVRSFYNWYGKLWGVAL